MTVHVVGNATVDITYRVRRLPRPGETLLAVGRSVDAGGKGLNQAIAAARAGALGAARRRGLGAGVRLIAAIGWDAASTVLRERLAGEANLRAELLEAPEVTDESLIMVADDGENAIVSTQACAAWLDGERAIAALGAVAAGDTLLMQGNLSIAATAACLAHGRARGLRTVLNPAPLHDDVGPLLSLVDLVVVNEVEATTIAGIEDPAAAAAAIRARSDAVVLLTLGASGCRLIGDGEGRHFSAPAVRAVDTAGAGDVFTGVVAAGLAGGASLEAATALAVRAAALAVTRPGTSGSFPTSDEIRTLLAELEG